MIKAGVMTTGDEDKLQMDPKTGKTEMELQTVPVADIARDGIVKMADLKVKFLKVKINH